MRHHGFDPFRVLTTFQKLERSALASGFVPALNEAQTFEKALADGRVAFCKICPKNGNRVIAGFRDSQGVEQIARSVLV